MSLFKPKSSRKPRGGGTGLLSLHPEPRAALLEGNMCYVGKAELSLQTVSSHLRIPESRHELHCHSVLPICTHRAAFHWYKMLLLHPPASGLAWMLWPLGLGRKQLLLRGWPLKTEALWSLSELSWKKLRMLLKREYWGSLCHPFPLEAPTSLSPQVSICLG